MEDLLLPFLGTVATAIAAAVSWSRTRAIYSAQRKLSDSLREYYASQNISSLTASDLRADLDDIALGKTANSRAGSVAVQSAFSKLNKNERSAFVEKLTRETERAKDALAMIIVNRALM